MLDGIEQYKEQFRSIVLSHIHETLPPSEWVRLREYAQTATRRIIYEQPVPDASPEDVVSAGLASSGMPASEVLKGLYKGLAKEIGVIANAPVYYLDGEGYYFWGPSLNSKYIWDVTITWPAYPPRW